MKVAFLPPVTVFMQNLLFISGGASHTEVGSQTSCWKGRVELGSRGAGATSVRAREVHLCY